MKLKTSTFSKLVSLIFVITLFANLNISAQAVSINATGNAPNGSAMLDISATNKGVLIPRLTMANRPASPVTGLIIYQTDNTPGFYYYDGSSWVLMRTSSDDLWTRDAGNGYTYLTNATDNVGINTSTPTQKFHSVFALDGGSANASTDFAAIYGEGTGDNDATQELVYGVFGEAKDDGTGTDIGYGVYGKSDTNLGGTYGVVGSVTSTTPEFTGVGGVVGYAGGNVYGVLGGPSYGAQGNFVADVDMNCYGGYFYNWNDFNNSSDNKYGVYSASVGDYGTKYGVYGAADYQGESNYGVYGYAGNSGGATTSLSGGVMGATPDQDGFYAVIGTAQNVSTSYFGSIQAGGLFNADDFGLIAFGKGSSNGGVGVWGIGYNGANSYWNGAGGSFSGYGTGLYATASDASNGNGIVAAANGEAAVTYTGGSGGSFTGSVTGVNGIAKGISDYDAGGYFKCGNGTWVYVGTSIGGTMYDTYGNGTNAKSVKSLGKGYVGMFTPISPEILLQDYGSGKLVNGKAHIDIDPVLTKNIFVNKKHPLRVFIQLEGDCKGVYVTNKTAKGFDVVELQGGMSNINFSWTITANRADSYSDDGKTLESKHVDVRFPAGLGPQKTVNVEKGKNSKINTLVLKTDKPEVVKFGKKGEINSKKLNTNITK